MADEKNEEGPLDNVRSISERAADGEGAEPEQETFPAGLFEPKDTKTLKTLVASGLPVATTVSMGKAEVPLRGGLPDPNRLHRALVTARFHKAEPIAEYDSDEETKVVAWKVRVTLKPRFVEVVDSVVSVTPEQAAALVAAVGDKVPAALDDLMQELATIAGAEAA